MRRAFTLAAIAFLFAAVAHASWYDDYNAGIIAVRKGQWAVAAQKMTAAIKGNDKEADRERTYGAIFISYHPYYYRGIANLNTGNYDQAIRDLERASGPGEVNMGPIEILLSNAKMKQAAESTPEPVAPTPTPVRPTPVPVAPAPVPTAPQIDPALRQRASNAINAAKQRLAAAQARKATASQQYSQATSMIADAATRNATAKSNDDYNTIISIAENASTIADLATAPGVPTPAPLPTPTRPVIAAETVLADYKPLLRNALENYFAGEFESAARGFEDLTRRLPNNGWIYAFLGASQYSVYAFEADPAYKNAAERSFKKAKQYGRFKNGLPERYFSRRIRKAFRESTS
ncbi:MAG TPA: hypothetical protein VN181_11820 [Thermoanaerobaculia bacterium]|nr:hypothetical protein [Thermoanaerobaculia bacterium]